MNYVNLGKTGLRVSRLCLGMMTCGSTQWRDWILNEEQSRPFIQRALELGINFFICCVVSIRWENLLCL
jgi:aryl-alcohol dehydrogenase (NADP+)